MIKMVKEYETHWEIETEVDKNQLKQGHWWDLCHIF